MRELRPEFPARYFMLKRVVLPRTKLGIALAPNGRLAVEGPSPAPGDDALLDGHAADACFEIAPRDQVPSSGDRFRVIALA